MYLPGVPCHVIQRGNHRDATFFAEQEYQFYLACLEDAARRYGLAIHAYVLMTYVHLLATPEHKESVGLTMQSVGKRYVQYVNRVYHRTGTLWEGRHKASLVDAEGYLMACGRYIELSPVAASMVENPADYRWSSFRCNAMGSDDPRVTRHELCNRLGATQEERQACYLHPFDHGVDLDEIKRIRTAAEFSMPLGSDRFKE